MLYIELAGVDVILDNMGGSYLQRNIDSLNLDGRLFVIGLQGGANSQINLASLLSRRLTVQGAQCFTTRGWFLWF